MLLYNNLLSLPVMLSYMVMATDELLEVHRFPLLWDMKFQVRQQLKGCQPPAATLPTAAHQLSTAAGCQLCHVPP